MIDYENLRNTVVSGLENYLGCTVRRSNQNGDKLPAYPYINYTITTLMSANKGTYGVYEDGKDRKQVTQTWSITALSDDNTESIKLACKAREWLDHIGTVYLNDNNVYVKSVGGVTNRDNLLTTGYEYRNGFDVFFNIFDVVDNPIAQSGYIETIDLNGGTIERTPTVEEQLEQAQKELSEANYIIDAQTNALRRLKERLEGGGSNE